MPNRNNRRQNSRFLIFFVSFVIVSTGWRGYSNNEDDLPSGRTAEQLLQRDGMVPAPERNWTSPAVNMEFVWIQALDCWVGRYPVTNDEYRGKKPKHDSRSFAGHNLNHDRQPVVFVNYEDARNYAQWLTEQDRASGKLSEPLHYRLPTADEWTTFAQCGDGREYPWGNNWPPESGQAGNYSDSASPFNWKIEGYTDGHTVACVVEESWENPWGLYGVGGNVWECTSATPGGEFDAWRGASWGDYYQDFMRCSARYVQFPAGRFSIYGFRLILSR